MKVETITETYEVYSSSVHPEVTTRNKETSETIAWADANPKVWKIVMGTKSVTYGKNASTYPGFARGDSPGAALERVEYFRRELENSDGPAGRGFFQWRAQFVLAHYGEKGYVSGFMQQHDEKYPRGCAYVDVTPETLEEVIDRFLAWCGTTFETKSVSFDKQIVRAGAGAGKETTTGKETTSPKPPTCDVAGDEVSDV